MTSAEPSPLTFRQALLAMLGVSLVLMLSALDQTVIGNALPSIVAQLQGFELYAWVGTGYLLASIVTIPIFGRLGDYYGRKPFVLAATVLFTLASLLCALASSMPLLVVGRVLQGVGGGMLVGTVFACVPELFPDIHQRLRWQMLLSAMFSVINAIGPGLGGYLTGQFGWRSVFWLNLPLGLLALFFAWRYLPWYRPVRRASVRLDWLGALMIVMFLGGLQFLVEGVGRPTSAMTLGAGALALMMLIGLFWHERRCTHALLPRALFADRSMRLLFVLAMLAGGVMFTLLFYLPLLLQGGYGYSPQQAGFLITPLALSITLGAIVNSRVMTRLKNPNWLPLGGFSALTCACTVLAAVGLGASFNLLAGLILLAGLGLGFVLLNLSVFTQTLAEHQYLGIATALQQSLRLVGGLIGTAVMGALVNLLYARYVQSALATAGQLGALPTLLDPQVLMAGPPNLTAEHLDIARGALASAIGSGLSMCAIAAALAVLVVIRLPAVDLKARKPVR
ncbi:MFS transporter [Pseudomonas sp. LRF_L74]|uniref:MFS transporter n=1 Tax=Pseudomonas sp. LRF_L74 TaxID=3369422 RepID=UPI003F62D380